MPRRSRPLAPPAPSATLLKQSNSVFQPDLWRIEEQGEARVWKTFRESPYLIRATVGRWLAAREALNLTILEDLPRVPRLLGRPEPWTVEMTWLDAEALPRSKPNDVQPEYFAELERLIAQMHERNINHGDLRRKNLMRDPETGLPVLIDFAQSFYSPSRKSLFSILFMRHLFNIDRVTLLKLKKWYLGAGSLNDRELNALRHPPGHLRFGRFVRKRIYKPFKHWRRGETKSKQRLR